MSSNKPIISTGLKITGLTLAVIIVAVIVIVVLSIYCIWPFKSLLVRCTDPLCKKTEDLLCDTKCGSDMYRVSSQCVPCEPGQVVLDNTCVSQCKPDEVYTPDGCVKRICSDREMQVENNVCVPDISGYYYEKDSTGKLVGRHQINAKYGTNVAGVKSSGKNIIIDAVDKELIGLNGLVSNNFTDSVIEWNDGSRWEKLV